MKQIKTSIKINASKEKIWNVLTSFDEYPGWNSFIIKIIGEPILGSKLKICVRMNDKKSMVFKPTLIDVEPNKKLSWLGSLFIKGLFDGHHIFRIEENKGFCVLYQEEYFSGLLVPLLWKMISKDTESGFYKMNQDLKQVAED